MNVGRHRSPPHYPPTNSPQCVRLCESTASVFWCSAEHLQCRSAVEVDREELYWPWSCWLRAGQNSWRDTWSGVTRPSAVAPAVGGRWRGLDLMCEGRGRWGGRWEFLWLGCGGSRYSGMSLLTLCWEMCFFGIFQPESWGRIFEHSLVWGDQCAVKWGRYCSVSTHGSWRSWS